jgi:hypothetical protein
MKSLRLSVAIAHFTQSVDPLVGIDADDGAGAGVPVDVLHRRRVRVRGVDLKQRERNPDSPLQWIGGLSPMRIETISIPLDPQTARAYSAARADEKMKMQALVSLWLRQLSAGELSSLEQVLDETGRKVQARGLTPEILDSVLKGA